jgi:hypothetical protein
LVHNTIVIGKEEPTKMYTSPKQLTWNEYVQTIAAVERVLIEQGNECFEQAGPSLMEIMSDPVQCAKLIIVSDGGAAIEYGSFGFVIATLDRVIWKCRGPVVGHPAHSFRAESTGIIAVIWFLRRFTEFFGIKPIGSPNCGLVRTAKAYSTESKRLNNIQ